MVYPDIRLFLLLIALLQVCIQETLGATTEKWFRNNNVMGVEI